jgi:hypothetical protein
MSKKIDWDAIATPHGSRMHPGQRGPKYRSSKEYLQKGLQVEEEQKRIQENMAKTFPALEALLKCRLENGTPLQVNRPISYVTSELKHQRAWNPHEEDYTGEIQKSWFADTRKTIRPGTVLMLKSLDPTMSEFIFTDQDGNEFAVPYTAKEALMTQTNVYEDVINFMNNRGE